MPVAEAGTRASRLGQAPWGLLFAALATTAVWLPFLHRPLTSDESGFVLLAQHWSPGRSLYGDYWVDRPPLLLWLFDLASHLAPTSATAVGVIAPGVKLLGALASGTSVLLVGVLGRQVGPGSRWACRTVVVLAGALLSSPLFGMPETDGEVLAVPFVLLGLVCLVAAMRQRWGRRVIVLAVGAGASAAAAALVKQNVIDVFVFAVVLGVLSRGRVSRLRARVAAFTAGAAGMLGAALAGAWAQGTSAADLWDAIVIFRLQALEVIGSSASEATQQRMTELVVAFLTSGAAPVLVVAAAAVLARMVRARRPVTPASAHPAALNPVESSEVLAWPAVALVGWELCGVVVGGSYWLHYLTGLVPGLVLLVAITRPGPWSRRVLTVAVAYTAAASLAVWVHHVATPVVASPDAQVMSYLREHAQPSDGVVVGFGHPDIVVGSGLQSPYEHLWSLPVRVRDAHLAELQGVLTGPSAPRWLVVAGDSLETWGVDADRAQQYLERHYVEQVSYGDWHIWRRQGRRQEETA